MTRQTTAPLEHQSLQPEARRAYAFVLEEEDGLLRLDPPYQRGTVWTTDQRIALVRSWLMGLPVGSVVVNEREGHVLAVVDGRQRIETALMWFSGRLRVPASWFEPNEVRRTVGTGDGPYVGWHDLTVMGQTMVKTSRAVLPRITVHLPTVRAEAELYLLLNGGGTPQTGHDMANAAQHARTT